ncbi:MAG: hypothetical protein KJ726_08870 [Verrucomicrobia bacterium]|nr:hypothetical protein [Verrucomicrobiota bacterium]MBU1910147.1 hypothetical protein [Verrucomicrobiota bacterium]
MKYASLILVLVAGLGVGTVAGWKYGTVRARHNCTFFLESMVTTEIIMQERAAGEAYRTQPSEVAAWALEQLLKTYQRYENAPEARPGERAQRQAMAAGIAHGRLARLYAALNQPDRAALHLQQALEATGCADAEQLHQRLDALDQAETRTAAE